jgi:hypothetical protein
MAREEEVDWKTAMVQVHVVRKKPLNSDGST